MPPAHGLRQIHPSKDLPRVSIKFGVCLAAVLGIWGLVSTWPSAAYSIHAQGPWGPHVSGGWEVNEEKTTLGAVLFCAMVATALLGLLRMERRRYGVVLASMGGLISVLVLISWAMGRRDVIGDVDVEVYQINPSSQGLIVDRAVTSGDGPFLALGAGLSMLALGLVSRAAMGRRPRPSPCAPTYKVRAKAAAPPPPRREARPDPPRGT